eukprot:COSAG04_NODE_2692_length_3724_cov_2.689379_3_plen_77_part_00
MGVRWSRGGTGGAALPDAQEARCAALPFRFRYLSRPLLWYACWRLSGGVLSDSQRDRRNQGLYKRLMRCPSLASVI